MIHEPRSNKHIAENKAKRENKCGTVGAIATNIAYRNCLVCLFCAVLRKWTQIVDSIGNNNKNSRKNAFHFGVKYVQWMDSYSLAYVSSVVTPTKSCTLHIATVTSSV